MWTMNGKKFGSDDIPKGAEGFVYIITDNDGKKYVGQKRFFSKRKLPPLKGKTRKRTKIVESDWQKYFGSSDNVKALLEERGPEAFEREILHICYSKGELNYMEMYEQVVRGVLFSEEYHNGIINVRINASHVTKMKNPVDA